MKKMIMLAGLVFAFCQTGRCDTFGSQIQTALLGHMETITETTTSGNTYAELLATPIQIGRIQGDYLIGVDAGVLGNIEPQPGQGGFNWTYGVHIHLTPIIKSFFTTITPDYPALTSLELNPRISIDRIDGHNVGTYGVGLGWSFGLTPLQ